MEDAMKFPFVASAVLFGLYTLFTHGNKKLLSNLFTWYFSFIGWSVSANFVEYFIKDKLKGYEE